MDTKTQRCVSCWYCVGFERLLSLPSHRTIRRLVNTRTSTHLFHLYFMFHRFLSHSKSIFCVIVYAAPLPIVIVSDRYNRIGDMMHSLSMPAPNTPQTNSLSIRFSLCAEYSSSQHEQKHTNTYKQDFTTELAKKPSMLLLCAADSVIGLVCDR